MKSKKTLLIALMWVVAIGVVVALYLQREKAPPTMTAEDAPVTEPSSTPPTQAAAPFVAAPPTKGPPRQLGGDRRNSGRSEYRGPERATESWTFDTEARIVAQPVIASDGDIVIGSLDGYLYRLSEHGQLEWKKSLGGPIYSTALIDAEGNIYVGTDGPERGPAGVFVSLTGEGEVRWRIETQGDADTAPTQAPNGVIHFTAGPDLFAVEADGTLKWRFEARLKIYTSPVVDEHGVVYFGSQDNHVYAIGPDGTQRWSYRTGGDNDASPAIADDGTIYFGSDDKRVYALTPDGELKWSFDAAGYVRGPISVGLDGSALVGVMGPRPRLVALSPEDGSLRWEFPVTPVDSTETGVLSGPTIDSEGNIYFGAHDSYLYSLTREGRLRWFHEVEGDVDSAASLADGGRLFFGADDQKVHALRGL